MDSRYKNVDIKFKGLKHEIKGLYSNYFHYIAFWQQASLICLIEPCYLRCAPFWLAPEISSSMLYKIYF